MNSDRPLTSLQAKGRQETMTSTQQIQKLHHQISFESHHSPFRNTDTQSQARAEGHYDVLPEQTNWTTVGSATASNMPV